LQRWEVGADRSRCETVIASDEGLVVFEKPSRDGTAFLAERYKNRFQVWEAGKACRWPIPNADDLDNQPFEPGVYVRLSPDGGRLWWSEPGRACLWDVTKGKPIAEFPARLGRLRCLALSPDGERLAMTTAEPLAEPLRDAPGGRGLQVVDTVKGETLWSLPESDGEIGAAAFSPDGKTLATGSVKGDVRRWEAETGKEVGDPLPHAGAIKSLAYSPDGKSWLTGFASQPFVHVLVRWGAAKGVPAGTPVEFIFTDALSLAFLPDGQTVVTLAVPTQDGKGSGPRLRFWDGMTLKEQELAPRTENLFQKSGSAAENHAKTREFPGFWNRF
jgi:WD40 repeat protein